MLSSPWKRSSLLALALLPSSIHGEAITESVVTPLGEKSELDSRHPAYGGAMHGYSVKPVMLQEQNSKATRNLKARLSDIDRLEAYLKSPLECDFNVLKESYSSATCNAVPWSGDYWPSYKDGINDVWKDGEPSPAEKYATAYGLDAESFMNSISLSSGVLSEAYGDTAWCSCDADCDGGTLCGFHGKATSGYCIPTWHGICHAWAAAALFEKEPKCDVVKNNVTFHSVDVKALMSQLYDGAAIEVVFLGARFNGPDFPEEMDEYGRYVDPTRGDLNAAIFHMAATNMLGVHGKSFIVDVSSGSEVWNQPVQSIEVLEAELVDASELSQKYFNTDKYPFNDDVSYLAKCTMRLTWTAESREDGALTTTGRIEAYTVSQDYEYCLELDENYMIVGGEWLDSSRKEHPDFLWFPDAEPKKDTVADTGISYAELLGLIEESMQCVDVTVSPEVPDASSTKQPGKDYTKSPSYTKTPSYTTAPSTYSPQTYAPVTYSPETYAPETYAPETYAPETYAPETYAPETYAPETYTPETYAPETYAPVTYTPETYAPETYAPETYAPETYAPETYAPETYAPETYAPETYAPETYTPETYAPETYAPETYAPETYTPETYAPETYAPVTYTPETYAPETYTPETYAPETYAPETYAPVTYTPETYAPETYAPETYSPETYAPETYSPETSAPVTYSPPTYTPGTYAPETYSPETYAPETYTPQTYAPVTYSPPTYTPETYAPETYAPVTYSPPTYPPVTYKPETYAPETYAPVTYSPPTYPPVTYKPETATPSTYPPQSMTPTTSPTLMPTSRPQTQPPKGTKPYQQANQSPTQNGKKWFRRLGDFTGLW